MEPKFIRINEEIEFLHIDKSIEFTQEQKDFMESIEGNLFDGVVVSCLGRYWDIAVSLAKYGIIELDRPLTSKVDSKEYFTIKSQLFRATK
jgi:hypothetical protein